MSESSTTLTSELDSDNSGLNKDSPPNYYDVQLTIVLSLLAWPTMFALNKAFLAVDPEVQDIVMLATFLTLFCSTAAFLCKLSKLQAWEGRVFMIFSITGMIANMIAGEGVGLFSGFVTEYLAVGEPHFLSPLGGAMALFDGTVLYGMYLVLIYKISNGKSWRSLGIYWASSIIPLLVVLLLGIFTGRETPTWCSLVNVVYVSIPVFILIRLLRNKAALEDKGVVVQEIGTRMNLLIASGLLYSTWLTFAKGMLCLSHILPIFGGHGPLLEEDSAPFARIQEFISLGVGFPVQLVLLLHIFCGIRPNYFWELSLFNGGYFLQVQFVHILTAIHSKTPPSVGMDWNLFWMENLCILAFPQALIWSEYKKWKIH